MRWDRTMVGLNVFLHLSNEPLYWCATSDTYKPTMILSERSSPETYTNRSIRKSYLRNKILYIKTQ